MAAEKHLVMILGMASALLLILFPVPGEMSDFMIGCSKGNFNPSTTCQSVCRLLQNRTSCCYGVNYDSRAVCACCHLTNKGFCPTVCNGNCHIITVQAGNCSELRGGKHRSGAGPSIINDLSILSDHPTGSHFKVVDGGRSEVDLLLEDKSKNGTLSPPSPSSPPSSSSQKNKGSMSSTSNKLFQRLSSTLDFI